MRTIHNKLKSLDGYLLSIDRDAELGVYSIKVGLPNGWVFRETNSIKCDVLVDTEDGKLIQIKPTDDSVVIDDLFRFFEKLIDVNLAILKREKEFQKEMEEFEKQLIIKKDKFYKELDELGDIKFSELENQNANEVVGEEKIEEVVGEAESTEKQKEQPNQPKKTTTKKETK